MQLSRRRRVGGQFIPFRVPRPAVVADVGDVLSPVAIILGQLYRATDPIATAQPVALDELSARGAGVPDVRYRGVDGLAIIGGVLPVSVFDVRVGFVAEMY